MSLRDDTQRVLQQVEELTGIPVEIMRDPDLAFLARITPAKGRSAAHILRINPTRGEPDYLIVYEAAFILRLYENPPAERFEFAGAPKGRAAVAQLVRRSGPVARLPDAAITQLVNQLFDGLMIQLRSYPIGMRIDAWMYDSFPALRDLQEVAIDEQQRTNLQALSPEVRAFAPKLVYEANVTMNAAYATFCDRLLGKKQYTIPYRSTGLEKRGRRLLDLWYEIPAAATHDQKVVDAWGAELGLADWYTWVPAQS